MSHFLHPNNLWSHKIIYFAFGESKGLSVSMGQDPILSVLDVSLLIGLYFLLVPDTVLGDTNF